MLGLGIWQLQRADEKRAALDLFHEQMDQPAQNWNAFSQKPSAYVKVFAKGHYLDQDWLLDNQIENGQFGYRIYTPFCFMKLQESTAGRLSQNPCLLVDRGWVAGDLDRKILPILQRPEESLEIAGRTDRLTSTIVLGDNEPLAESPYRVQQVQLEQITTMTGVSLSPWIIHLMPGQPGVYQQTWQPVVMGPEKHVGYAVQWFAMATVLAGLVLWRQFKPEHSVRETSEPSDPVI
ncbi:hypothetical protein BTA51_12430 [Hahella sp. CCB-MM4]|nr:hypothetical protein BTA51_12430 [Hahella sp. CCB-MM4]